MPDTALRLRERNAAALTPVQRDAIPQPGPGIMTLADISLIDLAGAALLGGAGLWLSAIAWGLPLPPFRAKGDRLYLIVPGQMLTLSAAAFALAAFGIPLGRVAGWLSAILTHGGP